MSCLKSYKVDIVVKGEKKEGEIILLIHLTKKNIILMCHMRS